MNRKLAKSIQRGCALAFCLVLLLPGSFLLAEEGQGELGLQGGLAVPDDHLFGDDASLSDASFLFGIRGGYQWAENWNWFSDLNFTPFETQLIDGNADAWMLRTGVERFLSPAEKDWRWFVDGGLGLMDIDLGSRRVTKGPSSDDISRSFLSLGLGQRFQRSEKGMFRWELRADRTLGNDGLNGEDLTIWQLIAGYSWGLGGTPKDADGDGVVDRKDRCPGTPRGALVDESGCPKDGDKDGVFDGLDKCPTTPEGWPVDGSGCAIDTDGDGVKDGADACPNTPKGASVDQKGCPADTDEDGVYNGLDKCPKSPKGAKVDRQGCCLDTDKDGVLDHLDKCPRTPAGVEVDAKGCKKPKKVFSETRTLVLRGVNFELDKDKLTAESLTILDKIAKDLAAWPEVRIEVGGHTDSQGSATYNETLSTKRAVSVMNYLIAHGVAASRIEAKGYGETTPIADNGTKEGRAMNRRVELKQL